MRWVYVDRIEELEIGVRAVGHKAVSGEAGYFRDHFPGFPVMPGVLLLEALAQLSGKLLEVTVLRDRSLWVWPIISMMDRVKFRQFVRPGETVRLESRLLDLRDESGRCSVRASVGGRATTTAEQIFVFDPEGLRGEQARRELAMHESKALSLLWAGWDDFAAGLPPHCRG